LYPRMGMMEAFVVQLLDFFLGKLNLDHQAPHSDHKLWIYDHAEYNK
jgi:hypothetical protein